ncbi:hypothetical protein PB7211_76 [Candidatus Pelagibacter sp. HTCC7211]|jgi:arsenate reductase|nr:hypothetical protein PB7211_76 [Candidatus Pelagibacter sp. HTCC7211]
MFKAYSAGNNPSGKINEDINKFLEKNKNLIFLIIGLKF